MFAKIDSFLGSLESLTINQVTDSIEIFKYIETSNKYQILDKDGQKWGYIAEKTGGIFGILIRLILRTHRPMNILVWNKEEEIVLNIKRPFYLFWSNIRVHHRHHKLGSVRKRFSIMRTYYDIHQRTGKIIARIKREHFSRRFSIIDSNDSEIGIIKKEMGPLKKELLTNADNFFVNFPSSWSSEDKSLVLAAAITIDMDFYEGNTDRHD